MANLIDSIGGGLLSSTYMGMRTSAGEGVRAVQNLLGMGEKPMYQLPYDHSLFGQVYDRALRLLPPSLAYKAKREMDMQAYKGMKLVQGFLNDAIDDFKGAAGQAIQSGLNSALGDKAGGKIGGLLGLKSGDGAGSKIDPVHLEWVPDDEYAEDKTGISGYKVKVGKGRHVFLTSRDTGSNKLATLELDNSQKFKPREDTLWYIVIDRYDQSNGNDYPSALPKIPTFTPKFADESKDDAKISDGSSINYLKWLPATDYSYSRRTVHNAIETPYGWGHAFNQISSITRGREFSITLEDDRDHSFSKYAKEVVNRSSCYETASVTYWECLLHKITLFILDRQWRVSEKYTLLGLLVTDGANRYQPEVGGKLVFDFQIVGELTGKPYKKLEQHVDGSDPAKLEKSKMEDNFLDVKDGTLEDMGESPWEKAKSAIGLNI